jgi:hypothetical protein
MGRPISLEDIPELKRKPVGLMEEALAFLESDAEAYELRVYDNRNTASATSSNLNARFRKQDIPLRSIRRGGTIYLVREKTDAD